MLQAIGDVQQFVKKQTQHSKVTTKPETLQAVGANWAKPRATSDWWRTAIPWWSRRSTESYNELWNSSKPSEQIGEPRATSDWWRTAFRKETDAALESYNEALKPSSRRSKIGRSHVLQAIGDVQQFRKETDAALESSTSPDTLQSREQNWAKPTCYKRLVTYSNSVKKQTQHSKVTTKLWNSSKPSEQNWAKPTCIYP